MSVRDILRSIGIRLNDSAIPPVVRPRVEALEDRSLLKKTAVC